jgi:hypothetical protein
MFSRLVKYGKEGIGYDALFFLKANDRIVQGDASL